MTSLLQHPLARPCPQSVAPAPCRKCGARVSPSRLLGYVQLCIRVRLSYRVRFRCLHFPRSPWINPPCIDDETRLAQKPSRPGHERPGMVPPPLLLGNTTSKPPSLLNGLHCSF